MKLLISNRSGIPIYEQIKTQIKEAIFSGELKEDEALPSIRQLAKDLKISVITTTRAYNDLAEEGYVALVQGKGCYVLPQNPELAKENGLRKIEQSLEDAIRQSREIGISKKEILEIFNLLYKESEHESRD